MAVPEETKHQLLSAAYSSPTNEPFQHTTKLPTPIPDDTASKVTYLSALRTAVAQLQENINTDLTKRMEEDKARDVTKVQGKVVDEVKEEETYGEEEPEED